MEDLQAPGMQMELDDMEKATDLYELGLSGKPLRRRLFDDEAPRAIATPARQGRGRARGGRGCGRGGRGRDMPAGEPVEIHSEGENAKPAPKAKAKAKGKQAAKAKASAAPACTASDDVAAKEGEQARKRRRTSSTSTSTTGTIAPNEEEAAMHHELYDPFVAAACEGLAAGTQGLTFMGLKDHVRANRIDTFKKVQLVVYWSRCAVGLRLMNDPAKPQILYVQFKTSSANDLDYNYSLLTAYAAVHNVVSQPWHSNIFIIFVYIYTRIIHDKIYLYLYILYI